MSEYQQNRLNILSETENLSSNLFQNASNTHSTAHTRSILLYVDIISNKFVFFFFLLYPKSFIIRLSKFFVDFKIFLKVSLRFTLIFMRSNSEIHVKLHKNIYCITLSCKIPIELCSWVESVWMWRYVKVPLRKKKTKLYSMNEKLWYWVRFYTAHSR